MPGPPLGLVKVEKEKEWPQKGTKITNSFDFWCFCAFLWPFRLSISPELKEGRASDIPGIGRVASARTAT